MIDWRSSCVACLVAQAGACGGLVANAPAEISDGGVDSVEEGCKRDCDAAVFDVFDVGTVAEADAAAVRDGGGGNAEGGGVLACQGVTNAFVIAGNDSVYSGAPIEILGGMGWTVSSSNVIDGGPAYVDVGIDGWDIELSTVALGRALEVGTYQGVERAGFETAGHAGLAVSGNGTSCDTVTGEFSVLALAASSSGTVIGLSATFEQHCNGGSTFNYGCVRVAQ